MGTSISQPSPRNTNWKPVRVCYTTNSIPENRIVNEIWRASENDTTPISASIKSETIFACYEAVKSSKNSQEAVSKFNNAISENKGNSIVAEFAKRIIPVAFQSTNPSEHWTNKFFSEITNYVVSRDTSGFVGNNYRNKSVKELIDFKKSISDRVSQIVSSEKRNINSQSDWNSFVEKSITKLKTNE